MKASIGLALILIIASLTVLLMRACEDLPSDNVARADSLENVIARDLTPSIDSARAVADSLTREARASDARLAEVEERTAERIEQAERRARAAEREANGLRSSLEERTDSIGRVLIAQRDSLHQEQTDSLRSIITAHEAKDLVQDSTINFWRLSSVAKDSVIVAMERRDSLRVSINDNLRSEVSRLNRRNVVLGVAGAGLVINLAACQFLDVGLACGGS